MTTGYEEAQECIRQAQKDGAVTLDLSGLKLIAVPPEIVQLAALKELDLITVVPPEIGQLTALQLLSLGDNRLTAVPEWLVQMLQLEELYIFNNPIIQPPPELLGKTLTEISLDYPVDLETVRRYYAQLA